MIYEYKDYRKFLKEKIREKQRRNPRISLKNLADQWGLAPSMFSDVLNGKRNLSYDKAMSVAINMGLKDNEIDYFCLLVKFSSAKKPDLKVAIQKKIETLSPSKVFFNFEIDMFEMISDWQHLAILGILNLESHPKTIETIAKSLKTNKLEIESALDRLERLELIKKEETGHYVRLSSDLFINAKFPSQGLHKYHKQMLSKAIDAVENQKFNERIIATENIIIDETQISEANQIIDEFLDKMSALTEKSKKKNKLYHLGTQFFKLTED